MMRKREESRTGKKCKDSLAPHYCRNVEKWGMEQSKMKRSRVLRLEVKGDEGKTVSFTYELIEGFFADSDRKKRNEQKIEQKVGRLMGGRGFWCGTESRREERKLLFFLNTP